MIMTHETSTGIGSTGDCSTGDYSTGDCSTGYCSTGDFSTGDWSTGNRSTGDYSTGIVSTGDRSTGRYSTGCFSTGDFSTGNYSTGDYSTGKWSISNYSTGHFSTEDYSGFGVFDKPCTLEEWGNSVKPEWIYQISPTEWVRAVDMTDEEKENNPDYETTNGYLKKVPMKDAWRKAWDEANEEDKRKTLEIVNFDNAKFKMISGIDVEKELGVNQPESPAPQTIVVDGRTYKLADENNIE